MTGKPTKTPREAMLNVALLGFHADVEKARKVAATTSGKGYTRDRLISNSDVSLESTLETGTAS